MQKGKETTNSSGTNGTEEVYEGAASVQDPVQPKPKLGGRESLGLSFDHMSEQFAKDINIVLCGPPRAGKSSLINALCGCNLAEAREGPNSVTQEICRYTREGQFTLESKIIHYKYSFLDTPGFEVWEKNDIRSRIQNILDKPDTKPVCMIFCTAPTSFVNVELLDWLLDKFHQRRGIFCALVCTNKHAGSLKSRQAVFAEYHRLLQKYTSVPPREDDGITYFGNVGLTAAVNCQPYESDAGVYPVSGLNELNCGIIASLADNEALKWGVMLQENQEFWDGVRSKAKPTVMKKLKRFMAAVSGKDKKEMETTRSPQPTIRADRRC